eukprot:CAMPEP_0177580260 /NCGR_PEP_ID=MMETSP0419_2-20121207/1457_1 /TAXON_ID=582737 /ORGANISM="Tetraselmis sp., Strain GSL018" /LENGTH=252 /DNA_ID=CAMNT_0019069099 /DNA_START=201 /DNA_END=959 /DNA_ORIENTATION=-
MDGWLFVGAERRAALSRLGQTGWDAGHSSPTRSDRGSCSGSGGASRRIGRRKGEAVVCHVGELHLLPRDNVPHEALTPRGVDEPRGDAPAAGAGRDPDEADRARGRSASSLRRVRGSTGAAERRCARRTARAEAVHERKADHQLSLVRVQESLRLVPLEGAGVRPDLLLRMTAHLPNLLRQRGGVPRQNHQDPPGLAVLENDAALPGALQSDAFQVSPVEPRMQLLVALQADSIHESADGTAPMEKIGLAKV